MASGATSRLRVKRIFDSARLPGTVATYRKAEAVYSQGDPCRAVMFLLKGDVRLSIRSTMGREATVAVLGPGCFIGEAGLAGQSHHSMSATASTPTTVLVMKKRALQRLLHEQHALSDRFIHHLLIRHIQIESDLVDQLIDSAEKRLARVLLRCARCGRHRGHERSVSNGSTVTLAEMAGITPSRVKALIKNFRRRGFIAGRDWLTVDRSLWTVLLND